MGRTVEIRVLRATRGTWLFPAMFAAPALPVALVYLSRELSLPHEPWWFAPAICVAGPLIPFGVLAAAWPRVARGLRTGLVCAAAVSSAAAGWLFRPDLAIRVMLYEITHPAIAVRAAGGEVHLSMAVVDRVSATAR